MTKNQRAKLVFQIVVFVLALSMMMVCLPYITVLLAIYFAIQIARQV